MKNLLLAATVLWCLYWFVHAWPYLEDDTYIHLEFARSFAAGHGFAFNGRAVLIFIKRLAPAPDRSLGTIRVRAHKIGVSLKVSRNGNAKTVIRSHHT